LRQTGVIGLLTLLLYNTFGLAISVLLLNDHYQVAVPDIAYSENYTVKLAYPLLPYSNGLEKDGDYKEVLRIQDEFYNIDDLQHQHDTLYIRLKRNQSTRDEFFELAGLMEVMTQSESTPLNDMPNAFRLFKNLQKIYLSSQFKLAPMVPVTIFTFTGPIYAYSTLAYTSLEASLGSPPPETV
jgi:hypothetical protein